jgi:hypothetical protein
MLQGFILCDRLSVEQFKKKLNTQSMKKLILLFFICFLTKIDAQEIKKTYPDQFIVERLPDSTPDSLINKYEILDDSWIVIDEVKVTQKGYYEDLKKYGNLAIAPRYFIKNQRTSDIFEVFSGFGNEIQIGEEVKFFVAYDKEKSGASDGKYMFCFIIKISDYNKTNTDSMYKKFFEFLGV